MRGDNNSALVCADSGCEDTGLCSKSWLGYCHAGGRWIVQLANDPSLFLTGQLVIRDARGQEVTPTALIADIIHGEAYSFSAASKRDIESLLQTDFSKLDYYILLHYIVTHSGFLVSAGLEGIFPIVPVRRILESTLPPLEKARLMDGVVIRWTDTRKAVVVGAGVATAAAAAAAYGGVKYGYVDLPSIYDSKVIADLQFKRNYPHLAGNSSLPRTEEAYNALRREQAKLYHPDKKGGSQEEFAAFSNEADMFRNNWFGTNAQTGAQRQSLAPFKLPEEGPPPSSWLPFTF